MKAFIAIMAVLLLLLNAVPTYAECRNESTWMKNFPDNWTMVWEYKVGELTVRNYRSPDNWLGIYYRTDYPSMIKEALITEAPAKTDFSSGMRHVTFGERHYITRLVMPKSEFYSCWREAYYFKVEVDAKVIKPGVWFSIVETEKEKGQ